MKPTGLTEHPEGGRFKEVFRSKAEVSHKNGKPRSALTHIYFSLDKGEVSRFHKVASDEVWNLYQGDGVRLYTWDGTSQEPEVITLSADIEQFCHVIPAGTWQAAESIDSTVLVGCSVAPGFDFDDFELIDPGSDSAQKLLSIDSGMSRFINKFN